MSDLKLHKIFQAFHKLTASLYVYPAVNVFNIAKKQLH